MSIQKEEKDTQLMTIQCRYRKCNNTFEPVRNWHKYCSSVCRLKDWDEKNPRIKASQKA